MMKQTPAIDWLPGTLEKRWNDAMEPLLELETELG
jgi:hypothetical protein